MDQNLHKRKSRVLNEYPIFKTIFKVRPAHNENLSPNYIKYNYQQIATGSIDDTKFTVTVPFQSHPFINYSIN